MNVSNTWKQHVNIVAELDDVTDVGELTATVMVTMAADPTTETSTPYVVDWTIVAVEGSNAKDHKRLYSLISRKHQEDDYFLGLINEALAKEDSTIEALNN